MAAADTLSRLRGQCRPVSGLLIHDWGDSAAVVFVPGTNATHLIDGSASALLADWGQPVAPDEAEAVASWLEAQVPALLQSGILVPCSP